MATRTLVFVPTMGRTNYKKTLGFLRGLDAYAGIELIISCPKSEKESYAKFCPEAKFLIFDKQGIGAKRQAILDYALKRRKAEPTIDTVWMFDDDLDFFGRLEDEGVKLTQLSPQQLCDRVEYVSEVVRRTGEFGMFGLSPRMGNNYQENNADACCRMMTVFGLYLPVIEQHKKTLRFDTYEGIEDLTFALRVLKLGIPNFLDFKTCWNQNKGSGSVGGCSVWRTREHHDAMVEKVNAEHPDVTTVRQANNKSNWGAGDMRLRKELTILWKNAYVVGCQQNQIKSGRSNIRIYQKILHKMLSSFDLSHLDKISGKP